MRAEKGFACTMGGGVWVVALSKAKMQPYIFCGRDGSGDVKWGFGAGGWGLFIAWGDFWCVVSRC